MSEELLDASTPTSAESKMPETVGVFAILSIVGSGLWALLLIISLIYINAVLSLLPGIPSGAIYIILLLLIGLNGVGIFGAVKMKQGFKSGFIFYAIVTGIWALLMLLGAANGMLNLISGILSIGFIAFFATNLKYMK